MTLIFCTNRFPCSSERSDAGKEVFRCESSYMPRKGDEVEFIDQITRKVKSSVYLAHSDTVIVALYDMDQK